MGQLIMPTEKNIKWKLHFNWKTPFWFRFYFHNSCELIRVRMKSDWVGRRLSAYWENQLFCDINYWLCHKLCDKSFAVVLHRKMADLAKIKSIRFLFSRDNLPANFLVSVSSYHCFYCIYCKISLSLLISLKLWRKTFINLQMKKHRKLLSHSCFCTSW